MQASQSGGVVVMGCCGHEWRLYNCTRLVSQMYVVEAAQLRLNGGDWTAEGRQEWLGKGVSTVEVRQGRQNSRGDSGS